MFKWLSTYFGILRFLFIMILFYLVSPYLGTGLLSLVYTLSKLVQDFLAVILPVVIVVYISVSLSSFKNHAWWFIVFVVATIMVMNLIAILSGFSFAVIMLSLNSQFVPVESLTHESAATSLESWFRLKPYIPAFWNNINAIWLGLVLGLLGIYYSIDSFVQPIKITIDYLFKRVLSPIIPIFALGFIAQLYTEQALESLSVYFVVYTLLCVVSVVIVSIVLYSLAANGLRKGFVIMSGVSPLLVIGFTTMSSLVAVPYSIEYIRRFSKSQHFPNVFLPTTVNTLQFGDIFINLFFCTVLIYWFNVPIVSFQGFITFAMVYTLTRFGTAAIPGGAIFIIQPLYQDYLHFNESMLAIILFLNIILDPIVTAANIYMKIPICLFSEKLWNVIEKRLS